MNSTDLKILLDRKYDEYNRPGFIENDPVSVPHLFSKKQDIEIAGFWTAILSWGQRPTIISKAVSLFKMMDLAPHDFILRHEEKDLKPFADFRHRTFNGDDALYFIHFFRQFYRQHDTLEDAFLCGNANDSHIGPGLTRFYELFFGFGAHLQRTQKHIATPAKNSACKRINMFLRWMVRRDGRGVDFGLWKRIDPGKLICPCDVHVNRVARKLGLINRKQTDWLAAVELTGRLKELDPLDPVKYDFALFGLGLEGF